MKMFYLANIRLPTEKAHGIQIMNMCSAFAQCGVKLTLIVPWRKNSIKDNPFRFYNIQRGFKIVYLPCLDLFPYEKWLGRIAFFVQSFSFLIVSRIYTFFKYYDFIYTRDPWAVVFFSSVILEIHAISGMIKKIMRFWKKGFKKFVVLTQVMKRDLQNLDFESSSIKVAADGVDIQQFHVSCKKEEARSKVRLPASKILVGYVGMLRTMGVEKGVDVVIKAMAEVPENVQLIIVGGHKEDILLYQELAHTWGVKEKVIFVGQVPHAEIPIYLQCFDMVIAPFPPTEHYKYYMSPLKLFEYMASNKPVVVTDLPSIREVLDDNTCFFVKQDATSVDFAQKIRYVIVHPFEAEQKAQLAKNQVGNFEWKIRAQNILDFISE